MRRSMALLALAGASFTTQAGEVSGGRGFARRITAGRYELCPSEPAGPETAHAAALIRLTGTLVSGILEITTSGLATLR